MKLALLTKLALIIIGCCGIVVAQTPAFTGEVNVVGADPLPSGKFATLRANVGVETAGTVCFLTGDLLDQDHHQLSFQNAAPQRLPGGRSVMHLDFPGAKVAQLKSNGPLVLSNLSLACQVGLQGITPNLEDRQSHRTGPVRAADFDDTAPDFEFVAGTPVPAAAGDPIRIPVGIRFLGAFDSFLKMTARADPPLQAHMLSDWACPVGEPCWVRPSTAGLVASAPQDVPPGSYGVDLTGRAGDTEHTVHLTVVIDPVLTARKREHLESIEALKRWDSVPPEPPSPVTVRLADPNTPPTKAKFYSDVELRKIHAVLVLDRSASMWQTCDFLKGSAARFADMFTEGRDSVGIISYSLAVETLAPLNDQFKTSVQEQISKMSCDGATNTGAALEAAQAELAAHEDPEAMNAVVLFTDGVPNVLTADWPVQVAACRPLPGQARCTAPKQVCAESIDGHVVATLMPTYSFAAEPPGPIAQGAKRPETSCYGPMAVQNFPYMPETDLQGIALAGSRPLERFADGPYQGKIQIASQEAIFNAIANEAENAARALRNDQSHPAFTYVIGFNNHGVPDTLTALAPLQALVNDPAAPSFDPKQVPGLAILTSGPADFWPAFLRVREEIVRRATLP